MPDWHIVVALTVFATVAAITPGPNNAMVLASSVNFGVRRTMPHMLGVTIGFMVMVILIGVGLGRVFDLFPLVLVVLKIGCTLYLLWLAWKIANAGPADGAEAARPITFLQAALFQWINPKAWMIAVTAVAAYILFDQPWINALAQAAIFGIVTVPSLWIWAAFGQAMQRFLTNPLRLRVFNVTMALLLVASLWPMVAEFVT